MVLVHLGNSGTSNIRCPSFCWAVYTSWRPPRINCRDQVGHIVSSFTFLPIIFLPGNVVVFNQLISRHSEQIATSYELRPLETKQGVREREATLSLIKKGNLIHMLELHVYGRASVSLWHFKYRWMDGWMDMGFVAPLHQPVDLVSFASTFRSENSPFSSFLHSEIPLNQQAAFWSSCSW